MLTLLVLPIATFIFALLSIAAMVVVVGAASRWPGRLFSYLMWLILSASVGTILLSERVLKMEQRGLVIGSEGDVGGTMLAKLLLAAVIGCSVTLCAAWIFASPKSTTMNNRFDNRQLRSPNDIVIAFMVFYIAFSILPLFFGQRYYFHISLIYPFFIFLALFLWFRLSNVDPIFVIKQCLAAIVLGSLIASVVAPDLAIQPGYVGLIPGFNSRLWGLASHANGLGSIACALLILEAAEPAARAWIRRCILTTAVVTLILTQSKTSIGAAFIGLAIIYSWRLSLRLGEKSKVGSTNGSVIATGVIGLFLFFIVTSGAWVMFSDTSVIELLVRRLEGKAIDELATGAGRTLIWSTAIQGGMENPLFGQGADFWSLENRLRWGLSGAVHAHNLFLQVFSRSGFVGLSALLVFLYFFFLYSMRASKVTRGGSIAVLAVFLTRAMAEVPISPNAILGSEFFAMMAYFIYIIDRGAARAPNSLERPSWQANFAKTTGIR